MARLERKRLERITDHGRLRGADGSGQGQGSRYRPRFGTVAHSEGGVAGRFHMRTATISFGVNLTALLTNQDLVVATPLNIAEETSSSATSAARISHDVGAMKHLLYGIPEAPPDRVKAAELATEILRSELLEVLIVQLASLPFECRKDAAQVFSNLPQAFW